MTTIITDENREAALRKAKAYWKSIACTNFNECPIEIDDYEDMQDYFDDVTRAAIDYIESSYDDIEEPSIDDWFTFDKPEESFDF